MGREVTREMQLSDPEPKFLNGTSNNYGYLSNERRICWSARDERVTSICTFNDNIRIVQSTFRRTVLDNPRVPFLGLVFSISNVIVLSRA